MQKYYRKCVAVPICNGIRSYSSRSSLKAPRCLSQSPSVMEYAPTSGRIRRSGFGTVAVPICNGIRSYKLLKDCATH